VVQKNKPLTLKNARIFSIFLYRQRGWLSMNPLKRRRNSGIAVIAFMLNQILGFQLVLNAFSSRFLD
jgi:hypothetical protein